MKRPNDVTSLTRVSTAVAVVASVSQFAQAQGPDPSAKFPVAVTAPAIVQPAAPVLTFGTWQFQPDVILKGEWPGSPLEGIPRWNIGFRAEPMFAGVRVGGMVNIVRGEDGPLVSAAELGTGRDRSHTGTLTGPGTYRTVFSTALTVSVPLKPASRVNLRVVGELWNPFFDGTEDDSVPLNGRAVKIGIKAAF